MANRLYSWVHLLDEGCYRFSLAMRLLPELLGNQEFRDRGEDKRLDVLVSGRSMYSSPEPMKAVRRSAKHDRGAANTI